MIAMKTMGYYMNIETGDVVEAMQYKKGNEKDLIVFTHGQVQKVGEKVDNPDPNKYLLMDHYELRVGGNKTRVDHCDIVIRSKGKRIDVCKPEQFHDLFEQVIDRDDCAEGTDEDADSKVTMLENKLETLKERHKMQLDEIHAKHRAQIKDMSERHREGIERLKNDLDVMTDDMEIFRKAYHELRRKNRG